MKYFIGIAAHKKYTMPDIEGYYPIQVGSALHDRIEGYLHDDSGINISEKNGTFSELTATYYMWKNVNAEYKGLVHYRRYFRGFNRKKKLLLTSSELDHLFKKVDGVAPKKRNYIIETNFSHYAHAHNVKDLQATGEIIRNKYPAYYDNFQKQMKCTKAHMFNMYILKAEFFDEYAKWLFDILFELERNIDISRYSIQEKRVFGYISELLFDVWINTNHVNLTERPVYYLEKQHVIKKIMGLIGRKFFGKGNTHIRSSVD